MNAARSMPPVLVVGERLRFEDGSVWIVERVSGCSATVRCVGGIRIGSRSVEFADGKGGGVPAVPWRSPRAADRDFASRHGECRACGRKRHQIELPPGILQCACGFAYVEGQRPMGGWCPVCGADLPVAAAAAVPTGGY